MVACSGDSDRKGADTGAAAVFSTQNIGRTGLHVTGDGEIVSTAIVIIGVQLIHGIIIEIALGVTASDGIEGVRAGNFRGKDEISNLTLGTNVYSDVGIQFDHISLKTAESADTILKVVVKRICVIVSIADSAQITGIGGMTSFGAGRLGHNSGVLMVTVKGDSDGEGRVRKGEVPSSKDVGSVCFQVTSDMEVEGIVIFLVFFIIGTVQHGHILFVEEAKGAFIAIGMEGIVAGNSGGKAEQRNATRAVVWFGNHIGIQLDDRKLVAAVAAEAVGKVMAVSIFIIVRIAVAANLTGVGGITLVGTGGISHNSGILVAAFRGDTNRKGATGTTIIESGGKNVGRTGLHAVGDGEIVAFVMVVIVGQLIHGRIINVSAGIAAAAGIERVLSSNFGGKAEVDDFAEVGNIYVSFGMELDLRGLIAADGADQILEVMAEDIFIIALIAVAAQTAGIGSITPGIAGGVGHTGFVRMVTFLDELDGERTGVIFIKEPGTQNVGRISR